MKYNCAVIGCGRIGCGYDDKYGMVRNHASAYKNNKRTTLSALCDVNYENLKKCSVRYGIDKLYNNYDELFENENLDIVSVCTLVDTHFEIVNRAIKNGVKGIFLEKPMSENLQTAKKITELCSKKGVSLQIDHQRRFIPLYHKIKNFLGDSKLGKIQHVNVYYGSGIANTGSHLFDMLLFLFGDIKSVVGEYGNNPSNNKVDPNIDGKIIFRNGITCSINSLDISHYGILEMDVLGTRGRLTVDMVNHSLNYFITAKAKFLDYIQLSGKNFPVKKQKNAPLMTGLNNLIDSIERKNQLLCSARDGYKSLEAIIAFNLAAENNRKIQLPLVRSKFKVRSK